MNEIPGGSRRAPRAPSMGELPALISDWVPGAGSPSYSGSGKEGLKQMQLHKCSLLFAQLEVRRLALTRNSGCSGAPGCCHFRVAVPLQKFVARQNPRQRN